MRSKTYRTTALGAFLAVSLLHADTSTSEIQPLAETYAADRQDLQRFYNVEDSTERRERFRKFNANWLARLAALDFQSLHQDGKIDYIVFRNALEHEQRALDLHQKEDAEAQPFVPFAPQIVSLEVHRQTMQPLNPKEAAATLSALTKNIEAARKTIEAQIKPESTSQVVRDRKIHVARAVILANNLRANLRTWFTFYNGYDPQFTWWAAEDYHKADAAFEAYTTFLSERLLGLKPPPAAAPRNDGDRRPISTGSAVAIAHPGETNDIIGNPVGREALLSELAYELIPYTPEQLLVIANREFAWCEKEMKRASNEMGLGDNWKQALEKVKNMYVEPGQQPALIRELALEAIQFMDKHDLVTIPPIARETWRMRMMTPQQQLLNPFFLGGETIQVSYPTDSMSYENKLMTMRGNNRPFSKATVFHELIPGHELQGYMSARFRPYRGNAFGRSAFVTEGWSLYWELLLWDMKFQNTPEERVGALFWHMHRCARIILR
jgi:uncharacterized protein (DUF885 family)